MKIPARASRLTLLLVGMVLLAAVILWSAYISWQEGLKVRIRFEGVRAENSHVSAHLRDSILELRSLLMTYEVTGEAARWQQFQTRSQNLSQWLDEAGKAPVSAAEGVLFQRIATAFHAYQKDAANIAATRVSEGSREALTPRLEQIERASQPLLTMGSELSVARRAAFGQYVGEAERAIVRMQKVIFVSLLALLTFGALSVWVIYRDTIAPLQVSLVETRELAQRQEKLAALGTLAAGVAHEIRNPLTAIKARLYTQEKALPSGTPAHSDALFIGKEIDRLARITTEFLVFARPPEPVIEPVSVDELLQNVRTLLAPKMAEEGIELTTRAEPETRLDGDTHQLQQVLINLVQNAAESIGRAGRISIHATASVAPLGGQVQPVVVFEVEDSGQGVPAEIQPRLFDPFFTTKPNGTGLGLSIAARIVEKHGGAIRYQDESERGAIFSIMLPGRP